MSDLHERFRTDFVWGAATSSYQIEGAADADGRGESIWDRFAVFDGKVRGRDTGALACDFYNRYLEDIGLMRELGLDAFRFSIAWPRVLPAGRGAVNERGLDFYDRLVDALLEAGIRPCATLYHWDLPQALEDAGGWPARGTADAFGEYAEAVAARLGDRVDMWATHNEPWVAAWLGYGYGVHAPGQSSRAAALAAAHNLLRSHGLAVDVLRRESPGADVGIVLNLALAHPSSDAPADVAAANSLDGAQNRWFLDPLFHGAYPANMLEEFAPDLPEIRDGDLESMAKPLDFLGVNYYTRIVARSDDGRGVVEERQPEADYTDTAWEVYPDGLRELLVKTNDAYPVPAVYVTENGAAYPDVRGHDGAVHDYERVAYLRGHLSACADALEAGVPVRGYFVWSLLDNYEWAWGYWKRFGIVYVDYPTQERVPKDSFHWYRRLIADHRAAHPRGATAAAR